MSADAYTRETPTADPSAPRLTRLGDLLGELEADAAAAHDAYTSGTPRGPVTTLKTLDRELGGALASGTHVLHAGPGAGKTALALQIAADCGFPALFVTCEMSALELLRRHTARVTSTYLGRLKSGELGPLEAVALARVAAEKAPLLALADATRAVAPAAWLQDIAETVRGDARRVLVVVDSLHSWSGGVAGDVDEYARLGAALGALRALAGVLNSPVLIVSERNRASMTRGGMSAGAGHRGIEYGAESLWELDRDENAAAGASGEVDVTLKIAKNRNGSPGKKIALRFHGALQRFREAD
ncbi:MAG: DnaB helicase C-terminal domain-containing protein [Chloroflexota bacterium]|nr:DnaB helicase C-terminal domain-containing protein [Chloroflexota bacterium]